jgi:non-specific serine/threonine protein kinase
MSTPFTLPDLLEQLAQGRVSLGDLVQQLNARGPVPEPVHNAELKQLDEALKSGRVDEKLHRGLHAKLVELQKAPPPPAPGDGDRTLINPDAGPPGDATVVNPEAAGGDGFDLLLPDAPDATVVNTGGGDASTQFTPTVVTGPRTGPQTGSRTGTSAPGTSSWNRLAAQAAMEPDREVRPGDVLKQRFVLEKEVGSGGMGVVFKAVDERKVEAQDRNPYVAVKILNAEFRQHPQALISLQRECRKSQQLTHDNILRVYDFDKDGTIVYMTMEYVEGGTLKEFIKKHPQGMPFDEAWPIIEGLARGLARAHRDGIVHSDFKPGNVMLGSDRIPKIFDLGIARAAKAGVEAEGETTMFDAGDLGALTPAYASLEMLRGEAPEIPDDVYALGISAYELLTGRHPYGKKNAEQSLKEGLKPARVPGLTRLQWRTLESALAFERGRRLPTADALIEGMRPRTLRDRMLPIAAGTVAVALLVAAIFPLRSYLKEQRITGMVQKFEQVAFAGTEDALRALEAMEPTERDTALQRGATPVQDYFFRYADEKWNVEAQRYDYAAAFTLISAVDRLFKHDSRRVSEYLIRIEDEKNTELNRLNEEFNERLAARRLFETQENSIVQTLSLVRRIDPEHALLKDTRPQIEYARNVRQLLRTGDVDTAEQRVATLGHIYPGADTVETLRSEVKAARDTQLAQQRQRELMQRYAEMEPEQVRAELTRFVSDPKFTPDWQGQVDAALSVLARDMAPETRELREQLADAYASQAAEQIDRQQYAVAQLTVERGLKVLPGLPRLVHEKSRVDAALREIEREQALQTASAEIEGLKNTLQTRAAANDIQGAEQTLAQLRRMNILASDDSFLVDTAPRAIGEAYLRRATRMAEQNKYADALRLVQAGLRMAPMVTGLKTAEQEYRLEGEVAELQTAADDPKQADGERLKAASAYLSRADSRRHTQLMQVLGDTAARRIDALAEENPALARRARTAWMQVLPEHPRLAALDIPEVAVAAPGTPRPAVRRRRPRPAVDPCQADFAGFGISTRATCLDALAAGQGPRLVVVPGIGGSRPFAITKFEVTVKQFNDFCQASGKCRPQQAASDTLPASGISYALARDYAEWLSFETGFDYRLPTEQEWVHAATAGGQGSGDDFNCVLMQGAQQIKGGTAIAVNVGKPNPWGLFNVVGNVAEWVEGSILRGGNFNVPVGRCTVEWRETSSGGGSETIGIRLVRDLG